MQSGRAGGRVLVVNGVVSDEMTLDFFSRLPNMIHGVERVILNGQELQCRPLCIKGHIVAHGNRRSAMAPGYIGFWSDCSCCRLCHASCGERDAFVHRT